MSFLFGQPMVEAKPKPLPTEAQLKQRWRALAPHVKRHFKTDMTVEDIAVELYYADYKLKKDKK